MKNLLFIFAALAGLAVLNSCGGSQTVQLPPANWGTQDTYSTQEAILDEVTAPADTLILFPDSPMAPIEVISETDTETVIEIIKPDSAR